MDSQTTNTRQIVHEIAWLDRKIEEVTHLIADKPSKIKQHNDLVRQRIHAMGRLGIALGYPFTVVRVCDDGSARGMLAYDSEYEAQDAIRVCLSGYANDFVYAVKHKNEL